MRILVVTGYIETDLGFFEHFQKLVFICLRLSRYTRLCLLVVPFCSVIVEAPSGSLQKSE